MAVFRSQLAKMRATCSHVKPFGIFERDQSATVGTDEERSRSMRPRYCRYCRNDRRAVPVFFALAAHLRVASYRTNPITSFGQTAERLMEPPLKQWATK